MMAFTMTTSVAIVTSLLFSTWAAGWAIGLLGGLVALLVNRMRVIYLVTIITDSRRRSVIVTGRSLISIAMLLRMVRVSAFTSGVIVSYTI